ncbi:MAG: hypothetical protein DRQ88_11690 [Epsilonproteobacteria bacterium]|nr:MAG: hypothetical protein DRQ88_11690 [Campylobacterota bacterium]
MALNVPIQFLCSYFNVSRSGYYAWLSRPKSLKAKALKVNTKLVKDTFKASRERYGSPRVYQELKKFNHSICENTVAKIMKNEGLIEG